MCLLTEAVEPCFLESCRHLHVELVAAVVAAFGLWRIHRPGGLVNGRRLSLGCALGAEYPLKRPDELQAVGVEACVPYVAAVASAQCLDRVWQVYSSRHASAIDKYWYHANVAPERSLNFQPYEVIRLVEAPVAVFVLGSQPVSADHYDQG